MIKARCLFTLKRLGLLFVYAWLTGCVISPLNQEGIDRSLSDCPPLPNCVSTEASNSTHNISPFRLAMPIDKAWPLIREAVSQLEGTSIITEHSGYIYAKSYSRFFHFVDYFEVLVEPENKELSVRSSSLLGISDLSVNYSRTERFRDLLEKQGVIQVIDR